MPLKWKSDPKVRGLIYADREDGLRVWGTRTSEVGKDGRRKDLKRAVGVSREAALQELYTGRKEAEKRKLSARTGVEPPDPGWTLEDLWKAYREELCDAADGTARERHMEMWLEVLGPRRPIASVSPSEVQAWVRRRRKELTPRGTPYKPASINRRLATLRRLFNLAQRDGRTRAQPVPKGTLLTENNKRTRILEAHEEEALLALASPQMAALIRLALLTGLRRGELCRLLVQDLHLSHGLYKVQASKQHEDEWLPIHPEAGAILRSLVEDLPPKERRVFPGLTVHALSHRFDRLAKRAGVTGASFHTLRHTFVSRLMMAGVPDATVKELARHRSVQMTDRYKHLNRPHLREALGRIGNQFGSRPVPIAQFPGITVLVRMPQRT